MELGSSEPEIEEGMREGKGEVHGVWTLDTVIGSYFKSSIAPSQPPLPLPASPPPATVCGTR
jgi:hypothetical protein